MYITMSGTDASFSQMIGVSSFRFFEAFRYVFFYEFTPVSKSIVFSPDMLPSKAQALFQC